MEKVSIKNICPLYKALFLCKTRNFIYDCRCKEKIKYNIFNKES